jgi:diguanylate cyclase (GGDEF)-like protein
MPISSHNPFTWPARIFSGQVSPYYEQTLETTTRIGAICSAAFETFFSLYYWLSGFPPQVVWLNIGATLISLAGGAVLVLTRRRKPAAHLVVLGIYISVLGPALYTGGVNATSLVWCVFIPVVATIMAGRQATYLWGIVCVASVLGMYLLNHVFMIDLTVRPPQGLDHLVDIAGVIIAVMAAAWGNETVKLRAIIDLEAAQAQLMQLAAVDPLTQTYNRRYFMEHALRKIQQSEQNSLLLMDIDHFKDINDTYRHDTGDRVLQEVCWRCKSNLRDEDLLARFGGEEFVILLPNTGLPEARQIAERLCTQIAENPIHVSPYNIQVSVSIGVACLTDLNQVKFETLLRQADRAMYQAKHHGRNRIFVWHTGLPGTPTPPA